MTSVVLGAVLALYLAASLALFAFGVNLTWFSLVAWRHRPPRSGGPSREPAVEPAGGWPVVTVQLPIYNERYVARRLVEAACALDYPRPLLQVQVLDDSDDDTTTIVADAVEAARRQGIDITHVRRAHREGYKAGALAAALPLARGSLVALFDADFVPPTDFLRRTVPTFDRADLAFVQARWGHLNEGQSWLTRLQGPAIDGHFLVEQQARGLQGRWFNFNGTAGVWRRQAIDDAGGWRADTLTEDLDLSYRAHLRGWRGSYRPDLVVPGELPATLNGFRRQQHRWARGSLECAARLLGPVWRSDASLATKAQASIHLLAYTVHLLLLLLMLTYPVVVAALARFEPARTLWGLGYLLGLASFAPLVFLVTGQALQLRGQRRLLLCRLPAVIGLVVFGSGLMVNSARAALQIITRPGAPFERTAKFGFDTVSASPGEPAPTPTPGAGYGGSLDRIVVVELAIAAYGAATAGYAATEGSWGIMAFAALFATGLAAVATTSIAQAMHRRLRPRRALAPGPAPRRTQRHTVCADRPNRPLLGSR